MARVSHRKQIADRNNNVIPMVQKSKIVFRAGLYRRLSLLDGGKGKESESLENQEVLMREHLADYADIEIVEVYTDNGETGTDFERPDFQRLMDDVRSRKINCVVVKDLSRFGRNYIEAGEYLEKIFPFLGVRFIAVNDNVDTFSPNCDISSILTSVKNLMNEAYSRDISQKIVSAFDAKRANGEPIYRNAPYGYEKSGDPQHPYRIDTEAAENVRMFFRMFYEGKTVIEIADYCNQNGILTPKYYSVSKGIGKLGKSSPFWNGTMIAKILRNPVYTGCMVQQKYSKRFCDNQPLTKIPRDEWVIQENINEPIIDKELFEAVQRMFPTITKSKTPDCPERQKTSLIMDRFYCQRCGKPMGRRWTSEGYYVYLCRTHASHGNIACDNNRSIRETEAESVIWHQLQCHLALIGGTVQQRLQLADKQVSQAALIDKEVALLETVIQKKNTAVMSLFEQVALRQISQEDYLKRRRQIDTEIERKTAEIAVLRERKAKLLEQSAANRSVERLCGQLTEDRISRETVQTVVDRIEFDGNKTLTILFKYTDILLNTVEM